MHTVLPLLIPLDNSVILTYTDQDPRKPVQPDRSRCSIKTPGYARQDFGIPSPYLVNGEETIIFGPSGAGPMITYYSTYADNGVYLTPLQHLFRLSTRGFATSTARQFDKRENRLRAAFSRIYKGRVPEYLHSQVYPTWNPDNGEIDHARLRQVWSQAFKTRASQAWLIEHLDTRLRFRWELLTASDRVALKSNTIYDAWVEAKAKSTVRRQKGLFG